MISKQESLSRKSKKETQQKREEKEKEGKIQEKREKINEKRERKKIIKSRIYLSGILDTIHPTPFFWHPQLES